MTQLSKETLVLLFNALLVGVSLFVTLASVFVFALLGGHLYLEMWRNARARKEWNVALACLSLTLVALVHAASVWKLPRL